MATESATRCIIVVSEEPSRQRLIELLEVRASFGKANLLLDGFHLHVVPCNMSTPELSLFSWRATFVTRVLTLYMMWLLPCFDVIGVLVLMCSISYMSIKVLLDPLVLVGMWSRGPRRSYVTSQPGAESWTSFLSYIHRPARTRFLFRSDLAITPKNHHKFDNEQENIFLNWLSYLQKGCRSILTSKECQTSQYNW